MLKLTGALTGDISVIVPAVEHNYIVWNATSGDFEITFKPSGGTGVVVTQGMAGWFWTDASTMYFGGPMVTPGNGNRGKLYTAASLSGASVTQTLVPAWATHIIIQVNRASMDVDAGRLAVRIGDSGGILTSNYIGSVTYQDNGIAVAGETHSTLFKLTTDEILDAELVTGIVELVKYSDTVWIMRSTLSDEGGATYVGSCRATLPTGPLDRVQLLLTTPATAWDNGAWRVMVY